MPLFVILAGFLSFSVLFSSQCKSMGVLFIIWFEMISLVFLSFGAESVILLLCFQQMHDWFIQVEEKTLVIMMVVIKYRFLYFFIWLFVMGSINT